LAPGTGEPARVILALAANMTSTAPTRTVQSPAFGVKSSAWAAVAVAANTSGSRRAAIRNGLDPH